MTWTHETYESHGDGTGTITRWWTLPEPESYRPSGDVAKIPSALPDKDGLFECFVCHVKLPSMIDHMYTHSLREQAEALAAYDRAAR